MRTASTPMLSNSLRLSSVLAISSAYPRICPLSERAQLSAALAWVREGDTLVVTKLDRLARSVRNLADIVETLEKKGVALRILNFGGSSVDTRGATGRLVLNMFSAIAQFEIELAKERQLIGIAKAKAEGKYKGRKPTARAKSTEVMRLYQEGKHVSHIAKTLSISRTSVYRVLEQAGIDVRGNGRRAA